MDECMAIIALKKGFQRNPAIAVEGEGAYLGMYGVFAKYYSEFIS